MATLLHPEPTIAPAAERAPLSERTRLALATGAAALALGTAGDAFAREMEPGAGWAVTLSLFIITIGLLARMRGGLSVEQRLLLVPIVFLAEAFAWRDAGGLFFFNLVGLLITLAVLSSSLAADGAWTLGRAGFIGIIQACVRAAGTVAGGVPMLVVSDIDLRGAVTSTKTRRFGAVLRGAFIALPLLFVFGALLMSADPLFARLLTDTFSVDLSDVMPHVVLTLVLAWLAGGYLRGALLAKAPATLAVPTVRLGLTEAGIVLGALDALFLAFLALQARYLFGGAEHVLGTAGLSFAQYARGGFYELLFVAVLALPVLLSIHAVLRPEDRTRVAYRRLAGTLAAFVGVMLFSAAARMQLYIATYGLTEDRIYASAIMLCLGLVFAAYYVTVLRGRPERLGGMALVGSLATLGVVNVMNPPAVIARVNLARAAEGKPLDGWYLGDLGAGAVPHTLRAIRGVETRERCRMASSLLSNWVDAPDAGWREWNKSRAEARTLVAARRAELERYSPTHRVNDCGPEVSAAAATAARLMPPAPAGRPWWESAAYAGVTPPLAIERPSTVAVAVPTGVADREAALALVDEWFSAASFSEGTPPNWIRLGEIMARGAALAPPRAELPVPGERPHGMIRTPTDRNVVIVGDVAQATAQYELRHEGGGPVIARGLAVMEMRRATDRAWRLTRVAWDHPPAPVAGSVAPR